MSTDPFSDILKFANAQSVGSGSFTVGGAWAIRWEADKIRFFGVVKRSCWQKLLDQLAREGTAELPGAGAASAQLAQLIFI